MCLVKCANDIFVEAYDEIFSEKRFTYIKLHAIIGVMTIKLSEKR